MSVPAPTAPYAAEPHPLRPAFARLSWPGRISLGVLALGVIGLSVRLWPQWRHNPDLSHGLFMPVIFLVLLHEARSGTRRFVTGGAATNVAFGVLLTGALGALMAAGLYAAAVDWSHALVNLSLTVSLVLFLGAALVVFAHRSIRLVPLNWTAITAVSLWLLTAPIPPGTYTRLTLSLQLWVSEGVLRSLHLLGIAAVRHGNIIDLANTAVGVEEACSGIRSLISCVFAAVFFSATLVQRGWARALILALAAPLALLMNFIRSLALTLLANNGVDIAGTWHDATGFAVLGVTAVMLGGLALALERGRKIPLDGAVPVQGDTAGPDTPRAHRPFAQWTLALGTASAAALVAFFILNTRSAPPSATPPPDLFALLPTSAAGWQTKTTDLYAFTGTLQTDHLAQRTYRRVTESGPAEIIIYVAYWRAGQAPVSLVAAHTPDACWPGSGWTMRPTPEPRAQLTVGGREIPVAEHRLFEADQRPHHVWFWHLYDGAPISYRDPYSAVELLRLALRYGFRREGDQLFVRVSSNRPWSQIAHEPLLANFFQHTRSLGL